MGDRYRIFGSELSPYSVKVRSYFRYKGLPHEWVVRNRSNLEEYQRYARLPLIPLVITPEDEGMQDSTPILEEMDRRHPEPSIHPGDETRGFLSALIEEYADEWVNKPMFHYRWTYEADQWSVAERIARENLAGGSEEDVKRLSEAIRGRMIPRLSFVGSSDQTREQIERSFERLLALLEPPLADRPYLFGRRPVLADFGLFAQLYQCMTDPTAGAMVKQRAPRARAWIERMLDPQSEGELEGWDVLAPTLLPLLEQEVAGVFFPWTTANAQALARGGDELEVDIEGRPFRQKPQKYHAKSLGVLRARYRAVKDKAALDPVLERTGCRQWLAEDL